MIKARLLLAQKLEKQIGRAPAGPRLQFAEEPFGFLVFDVDGHGRATVKKRSSASVYHDEPIRVKHHAMAPSAPRLNPFLKLALELGPLGVFFVANQRAGIFMATGIFIAATVLALGVHYALVKKLPIMPLVSGAVVVMFGLVLLGGLWLGRPLLAVVLDSMFDLTDEGWRKLTLRWALFFFVLAALNEIV